MDLNLTKCASEEFVELEESSEKAGEDARPAKNKQLTPRGQSSQPRRMTFSKDL